jgi:hypothetical protein
VVAEGEASVWCFGQQCDAPSLKKSATCPDARGPRRQSKWTSVAASQPPVPAALARSVSPQAHHLVGCREVEPQAASDGGHEEEEDGAARVELITQALRACVCGDVVW